MQSLELGDGGGVADRGRGALQARGALARSCSVRNDALASGDDDRAFGPTRPEDIANALAFALRYSWRKRVQDSTEIMAAIVAKRLIERLDRCGFIILKKPSIPGSAPAPSSLS